MPSTREKTMTSFERVEAMFDRADQDRIPRHDTFWDETIDRWRDEGLDGDAQTVLRDYLDSDFGGIGWCWPGVYQDERTIEEDEQTLVRRDRHGRLARWWKGRSGTPEHLGFECDSKEKWFEVYKPMFLEQPPLVDLDRAGAQLKKHREAERWTFIAGVEPFEGTRAIIGDEETAIGMAAEPEWIDDFARTFVDRMLAEYQRVLDAGHKPDGLWCYGDMAFNHATFCSPAMYKELIWPQHKRLADFAHENGMRFIYHTDGNVNAVLPLFIDAGFDCFQPIEAKAHMDIREFAPKYGDKLAMFGNIDVMVIGSNDPDKLEHEVRTKLQAGMAVKGYAYHSDHSVPPSTDWKTYLRLIELIDRYGWYD